MLFRLKRSVPAASVELVSLPQAILLRHKHSRCALTQPFHYLVSMRGTDKIRNNGCELCARETKRKATNDNYKRG